MPAVAPRSHQPIRDHIVTWSVLVASAAMLAWMGRALVTGGIPLTGDLLHFHYPLRDFYARALATGQAFDWMPGLYSGFYVVGEGQLGAYHPLHWLLYRMLPLDRAFLVEVVLAYPVLFAGVWSWLRRRCGDGAAACGAMVATFSGFALVHGVHPNVMGVVAHTPWVLLALDRAVVAPTTRAALPVVAAVGLLTGSEWLLGHPQAMWFSGLFSAIYAGHLLWRASWQARGAVGLTLAGGLVLGAAVGAVQVLATLDAVRHATRPAYSVDFATAFSLQPLQLLQFVHPFLMWGRVARWNEAPGAGDEYGVYGGGVALVLAVWWLARSIALRADVEEAGALRFGWFLSVVGLLGAWLATGQHGGLYLVQTWLPVLNQFRAPVRYTLFTQWALAVLAALALARLLAPKRQHAPANRRALWGAGGLALFACATAPWLAGLVQSAQPSTAPTSLAVWWGPAVLCVSSGLLVAAVRGARPAIVALVLLAAADLGAYGLNVIVWQDFVTRQDAVGFLDTNAFLPTAGPGRLVRGGFPDLYLLSGHRLVDGYLGITPQRQLDYRQPRALRLAQVEYAHQDFLQGTAIPGAEARDHGWLKVPPPLPRARLVAAAVVSTTPASDVGRIDVDTSALVTHDLGLVDGTPGAARIVDDRPGEVRVEVQEPTRQLLVLSESFDDGWTATIDGVSAPSERVNGDFLGCVVPPGAHRVVFAFRPAHLRVGKAVSLAGFVLALGLVLLPRRQWRGRIGRF